jgi:hypothetical protein
MDGFKPSEPHQDSAATTSSLRSPELAATAEKSSQTPELAVAPGSLTLTDFSQPSAPSTRKPKCSKGAATLTSLKSVAGSTSSEKRCSPYWNKFCQEMSDWLSLPTKTGWREKALTCFDGAASKTGACLVVLNEGSLSRDREMVEDILAILHGYRFAEASYSSRLYGLRKYKAQVKKDPDLPKPGTQ